MAKSDNLNELKNLKANQIRIYKGLKAIGEDIASFYLDGVNLFENNEFKTKSNLLAHIAREIDGGLRDILSPEKEKKITQDKLKNEKYKQEKGHVASILTALDTDLNSNRSFA
ncbi:MAG: hypothetical protein PQ975_11055 [Methanobacterium sp.]